MKIQVVCVTCGPASLFKAWLANQRWAFKGHDVSFHIACHPWMRDRLPDEPDVKYLVNTKPFWVDFYSEGIIKPADDVDVIATSEMDCFWHERPRTSLDAASSGSVCTTSYGSYLDLVNEAGELVYPRLWEGGGLFNAEVVRRWQRDGITEGNRKWLVKKNPELWQQMKSLFDTHRLRTERVQSNILDDSAGYYGDPFVENFLWCAMNKIPYKVHDKIVHLTGGDQYGYQSKGCEFSFDIFEAVVMLLKTTSTAQSVRVKRWATMLASAMMGGGKVTREQLAVFRRRRFMLTICEEDWEVVKTLERLRGVPGCEHVDEIYNLLEWYRGISQDG